MRTLDAQQAADLLHINVKRIQDLARSGKLPAVRVGRKWLFRIDQIETLLGGELRGAATPSFDLSARNRLRGKITHIRTDGLMAEVQLRIGDQELVSVITRSSVERLGLKVGDQAVAVIKSTEIMIGKEGWSE